MIQQELETVLEEISIKNLENFDESKFIDLIKEKMPGWEITVWDADETDNGYKDGLTGVVADCIIDEIKEGRTNIQHGHWTTNCEDLYYYVVASKKD